MPQTCKPKNCKVCSMNFQPTGRSQTRCPCCVINEIHSLTPPLCKCGCGTPLKYHRRKKGYGEYAWGHRLKHDINTKREETIDIMRHPSPIKGQLTIYPHTCGFCKMEFRNKAKDTIYCSKTCYHKDYMGPAHPWYKRGYSTKYKYYWDPIEEKSTRLHRVIMEAIVGRKLVSTEEVHHIDENGLNNNPSNLHLFHCGGCHSHHHTTGKALLYFYTDIHPTNHS